MVTNLTNTTWEFNDTLSFTSAELIGVNFSINFTAVNGNSYTYIRLGLDSFNGETFFSSVHYGNTLVYGSGSVGGWVEQFAKTITITGGQDVTNPQLISWLEANGTLQGGETPTPKLYIGNKAVTSMSIGNKAILKMYVGNSLIYEKASGEESVSIEVVNNGTYASFNVYFVDGTGSGTPMGDVVTLDIGESTIVTVPKDSVRLIMKTKKLGTTIWTVKNRTTNAYITQDGYADMTSIESDEIVNGTVYDVYTEED